MWCFGRYARRRNKLRENWKREDCQTVREDDIEAGKTNMAQATTVLPGRYHHAALRAFVARPVNAEVVSTCWATRVAAFAFSADERHSLPCRNDQCCDQQGPVWHHDVEHVFFVVLVNDATAGGIAESCRPGAILRDLVER